MKRLLIMLIAVTFVFTGCKNKTTDSNNETETYSYTSLYVKENIDYFNFADNQGSTNDNSDYDVMFYAVQWQPPGAPIIIFDPRFAAKEGLSVAVLEGSKLDDVTEVPSTANFVNDFVSELGEWYNENDQTHVITPKEKVYVVNTTDGKFPAFQITNYYGQVGETVDSGFFSFDWKYLSE